MLHGNPLHMLTWRGQLASQRLSSACVCHQDMEGRPMLVSIRAQYATEIRTVKLALRRVLTLSVRSLPHGQIFLKIPLLCIFRGGGRLRALLSHQPLPWCGPALLSG